MHRFIWYTVCVCIYNNYMYIQYMYVCMHACMHIFIPYPKCLNQQEKSAEEVHTSLQSTLNSLPAKDTPGESAQC